MKSISQLLVTLKNYAALRNYGKAGEDQRKTDWQQLSLFVENKPRPEKNSALPELWKELRRNYFSERADLDEYLIVWSTRRHKSTLASCNVERRKVLVAGVFQLDEARPYLEALLYHEMCHAVLGKPPIKNNRRIMHGKDFYALECRHPGIPELDRWVKLGGWREAAKRYRRIQTTQKRALQHSR
jgi:hypothetical protein